MMLNNSGTTTTRAQDAEATDDRGVLSGTLALTPVAGGASIPVQVPLRHIASSTGPIGGTHVMSLTVGTPHLAR